MVHNPIPHAPNGMPVRMGIPGMANGVPPNMMYAGLDLQGQQAVNGSNVLVNNPYNLQNGMHHQHALDRLKIESEMASPPITAAEAPAQQPVGTNLSLEAPHVPQESSALGSVKITPPHSNMSSMQLDHFEFGLPSHNNSPDGADIIPLDQEVPFMRETDPFSPCNLFGSPNLLSGPDLMSMSNSGMNCGLGMSGPNLNSVTNMSMSGNSGNKELFDI